MHQGQLHLVASSGFVMMIHTLSLMMKFAVSFDEENGGTEDMGQVNPVAAWNSIVRALQKMQDAIIANPETIVDFTILFPLNELSEIVSRMQGHVPIEQKTAILFTELCAYGALTIDDAYSAYKRVDDLFDAHLYMERPKNTVYSLEAFSSFSAPVESEGGVSCPISLALIQLIDLNGYLFDPRQEMNYTAAERLANTFTLIFNTFEGWNYSSRSIENNDSHVSAMEITQHEVRTALGELVLQGRLSPEHVIIIGFFPYRLYKVGELYEGLRDDMDLFVHSVETLALLQLCHGDEFPASLDPRELVRLIRQAPETPPSLLAHLLDDYEDTEDNWNDHSVIDFHTFQSTIPSWNR